MDEIKYVPVDVHNEFARRVDEENSRQNKRLEILEENIKEIQRLTVSVERMAVSLEQMTKEMGKQGERLDAIEKEPADKWKNAVWIVISALIAAGIGALIGNVI